MLNHHGAKSVQRASIRVHLRLHSALHVHMANLKASQAPLAATNAVSENFRTGMLPQAVFPVWLADSRSLRAPAIVSVARQVASKLTKDLLHVMLVR